MNYKHGMSNHPLYKTWKQMHQRCYNPFADQYRYYGGRGIKIDPRWDSFPNFVEDVGERPEGCTLDRIRNNEDYSKDNFRWSTRKEQANNRRNSKRITFESLTMTTYMWGRFLGIVDIKQFSNRIIHHKWSFVRAATTPIVKRGKGIRR